MRKETRETIVDKLREAARWIEDAANEIEDNGVVPLPHILAEASADVAYVVARVARLQEYAGQEFPKEE